MSESSLVKSTLVNKSLQRRLCVLYMKKQYENRFLMFTSVLFFLGKSIVDDMFMFLCVFLFNLVSWISFGIDF